MKTLKKWPDIVQFRNVIRSVKDHVQFSGLDSNGDAIFDPLKPLPTLTFEGSVKLHGTSSAWFYRKDTNEMWCQSRERIISHDDDNAGFSKFITGAIESCPGLTPHTFLPFFSNGNEVGIYGEWCGGNIQKGVALNQLPKMFVIFGAQVDDVWVTPQDLHRIVPVPELNIHSIYEIPTYTFHIDFARPELIQNEIIRVTTEVENECPWGKKFGVSGVGEGIVLRPLEDGWESSKFIWKSKGAKHSISRVKTLVAVDTEKAASINEFVDNVVTPERCQQSIDKLKEAGNKDITRALLGTYLKWIVSDIIKEESDTAKDSGIDIKEICSKLSQKAKEWFFINEDTL